MEELTMEKTEILAKINDTMGSLKKKLDSFISEDEAFWMAIAMFLFGVIVGMFISPRKTKTVINDSYNGDYDDDYEYEYCDDDCDCDCCD
jgi:hypothetical protein